MALRTPNTRRNLVITALLTLALVAGICPAKPAAAPKKTSAKVMIVTGVDYPGHKWKLTAPALAKELKKDTRLKVETVEKPEFLATDEIFDYDCLVIHFMDWEVPDPGPKARENLKKFVTGGGGLVFVHFACGAFQEWPEFVKIAGRVWDPKLRGHDPHGQFRVEITDNRHPITRGLKPFEITDELYTCLTGDTKIKIIASAKSKVDSKIYPMAFVLNVGKGRVFHSVLGHDVVAVTNKGAAELYTRAAAWTAKLPPAPPAR